jgi:hypothetical protein
VLVYYASTPLFATDDDAPELAEYEEIPAINGQAGTPKSALSRRRGFGVQVSEQDRTRNHIDTLNTQLTQVRNVLTRTFDGKHMQALDDATPNSHGVAAASTWDNSSTVRKELAAAGKSIVGEKMGFTPDTVLVDQTTAWNLVGNDNVWKVFVGNVAGQNPQISGTIPSRLFGLRLRVTADGNIPAGSAYVMQQGIFGGIANERPLQTTGWYRIRQNETWRDDITRSSAAFCDQPKATAEIAGVR